MLNKSIIKKKFGNPSDNTKVKVYQVVEAILYRLKTGCQWQQLPMKQFFRIKYKTGRASIITFKNGARMEVGK